MQIKYFWKVNLKLMRDFFIQNGIYFHGIAFKNFAIGIIWDGRNKKSSTIEK